MFVYYVGYSTIVIQVPHYLHDFTGTLQVHVAERTSVKRRESESKHCAHIALSLYQKNQLK